MTSAVRKTVGFGLVAVGAAGCIAACALTGLSSAAACAGLLSGAGVAGMGAVLSRSP